MMKWVVRFHDEFEREFMAMAVEVQDELLARARLIATVGPTLGRPQVDTLAGSKHANMKGNALRCRQWRLACCLRIRSGTLRNSPCRW
jgi:hypothetical protein